MKKSSSSSGGMTIGQMCDDAFAIAEEKGFHKQVWTEEEKDLMLKLALIGTEVSEAIQEVKRNGLNCDTKKLVAEELADIIIRVGDLSRIIGIALEREVNIKMLRNKMRKENYGTPKECGKC